jgi:glycogen debranching enzyme
MSGQPGTLVAKTSNVTEPELEILFDGTSSVRLLAQTAIRLESAFIGSNRRENARHAVAYPVDDARFVVNAKVWLRRYGVEILRGTGTLDAPWDGEVCTRADIDIRPDADGIVEVAIDEFSSTWVDRVRDSSRSLREQLASAVASFAAGFDVVPERRAVADAAAGLIWTCTQSPSGIMRHEAIFMSLNWMDSVWSWDNWINMAPLTIADPDLAWAQFSVVADHQDEYGAYPDAVNDGFLHFNFAKPPVQGLLADLIAERDPAFWTPARLGTAYTSLSRFTEWWLVHRRRTGDRLCHYLHGNDSGWDNGTLLREGVPVITPDLNAFLVRQCRTLSRWARVLGHTDAAADAWDERGDELRDALVAELWRGDRFVARHVPTQTDVDSQSLAALLPLVIGDELPKSITRHLLAGIDRCTTHWGLASEAPESPYYEATNYWRGPVWAPTTLIAVDALRRVGAVQRAQTIRSRYLELVERSGFAENFHAETGAPLVDPGYTWTAAVYLLFAQDELNELSKGSQLPPSQP